MLTHFIKTLHENPFSSWRVGTRGLTDGRTTDIPKLTGPFCHFPLLMPREGTDIVKVLQKLNFCQATDSKLSKYKIKLIKMNIIWVKQFEQIVKTGAKDKPVGQTNIVRLDTKCNFDTGIYISFLDIFGGDGTTKMVIFYNSDCVNKILITTPIILALRKPPLGNKLFFLIVILKWINVLISTECLYIYIKLKRKNLVLCYICDMYTWERPSLFIREKPIFSS
jgi:hypothetical protein